MGPPRPSGPDDVPMTATPVLPLSPLEARLLAVLVEKQHTVPDTYPLSLNALVSGCNQKTSRDPVMDASDAEVQSALEGLRERVLAIESSGGRVMRYSENARRANCERLHRFSDVSATEGYLEELAARAPQPYVRLLPRQPGARESRWTHLLCGEPEAGAGSPEPSRAVRADAPAAALDALRERVERLESEVAALREALARR